ncbi:MAG: type I-U CRISPR-associated protein Cas7 [Verrucomicrobiaceae bacterium]|nr:type I-U CRISPR-associated protein Cas7 [Verrucomicrobiaceae bacterium]
MTLQELSQTVSGPAAAFRCRTRLQPAGGEGDKVFPPTYAGAVYAVEQRQVADATGKIETRTCVLLDSVQSQANRMEDALQQAIDNGETLKDCPVPVLSVDFTGLGLLDEVGRVTSLEAPHRAADAILRDSLLDGVPFRKSDKGKLLDEASLQNATPLYKLCPTALVFGIWDSTGPKGGLGAKFQRAMVSEIIGVNAQIGKKTSSRIDPLGMRAAAKVIKKADGSYELAGDKTKDAVSPSEVNHGNIPPDFARYTANVSIPDPVRGDGDFVREKSLAPGGVTIDYAEQITVLSLPALRRLRFPVDGKTTPARDNAGRTVLAALALTSAALAAESGFDLRSRCLLWPEGPLTWELLKTPGAAPEKITLTSGDAIKLLKAAVEVAEKEGLNWFGETITLKPAPNLIALLKRSQDIAAKVAGDADPA